MEDTEEHVFSNKQIISDNEDEDVSDNEDEDVSDNEANEKSKKMYKKINLTITKSINSFLENNGMVEVLPIGRIRALIKSDFLKKDWTNITDPHNFMVKQHYDNEISQITAYLKKYDNCENGVKVNYTKPKHKWGRPFCVNSLGLTSIRRKVRNTLITELYKDYDIANAQPNIIVILCKSQKNQINCKNIEDYCLNRDHNLNKVMKKYEVTRSVAKELFIRLCFCGTFKGWLIANKIKKNKIPLRFIIDFQNEIIEIAKKIKEKNSELFEVSRRIKNKLLFNIDGEENVDKALASMLGLYLQEWEFKIVNNIIKHLHDYTKVFKNPFNENSKLLVGSYEYDGIKLWGENVDIFEKENGNLIDFLNKITIELTGFKLEWVNKDIEDPYDISNLLEELKTKDIPDKDFMLMKNNLMIHLSNSDKGICDLLKIFNGKHYLFIMKNNETNGQWCCWDVKGNRWTKGAEVLRRDLSGDFTEWLRNHLTPYKEYYIEPSKNAILNTNQTAYGELNTEINNSIKTLLMKHSGNDAIIGKGRGEFRDCKDFDTNEDLFGCENGVIDIKNECFRPFRYDDFVSMSCGKNTANDEEKDHFKPFMKGLKVQINAQVYAIVEELKNNIHFAFREITKLELNLLMKSLKDMDTIEKTPVIITIYVVDFDTQVYIRTREADELTEQYLFNKDSPNGEVSLFRKLLENEGTEYDNARVAEINDLMKNIITEDDLREYLWLILASGISGKCIEKFFVFNGCGRNGKGFIDEFMIYCLGDYAITMNVSVLTEHSNKDSSGGANAEKSKLNKMRFIISAEPHTNAKINNSTLKKLTGGGCISARGLYSNNCEVLLHGTLIMECNNRPLFMEEPLPADTARINDIYFGSHFTDIKEQWNEENERNRVFKADTKYKTSKWKREHKNAFLNILFLKVIKLKNNNWNIDLNKPESVRIRSEQYLNKSHDIYGIFKELFEENNKSREHYYIDNKGEKSADAQLDWTLPKIVSQITNSKQYEELIKDKSKRADYGTAKLLKNWFNNKTKPLYTYIVEDNVKHITTLKGWRRYNDNEIEEYEEGE